MVEEDPLAKKQSSFVRDSLNELTELTKDVLQSLEKTTSSVDAHMLVQKRMQEFFIQAFETLQGIDKARAKETEKRVFWKTAAITHLVVDLFVGIIFIIMLYAART